MTCCTTLLADYFHGAQRERYFGLQVVCTTVAATIFFRLGGALGAQDRRTPFRLYAVSLPLALLAARGPAVTGRWPSASPASAYWGSASRRRCRWSWCPPS